MAARLSRDRIRWSRSQVRIGSESVVDADTVLLGSARDPVGGGGPPAGTVPLPKALPDGETPGYDGCASNTREDPE
jgi:hypothetical protein